MSKPLPRPPVQKALLDFSSTNVTTSAYVTVVSSMSYSATAVEIFNGSGSILVIATGAAASEVDFAYYILPGGSTILLPLEFTRGQRISIKAVDQSATGGLFILNFFA